MKSIPHGEVTELLEQWQEGQDKALEELLPLVYEEMRKLASSYLRRERQGHTLQATALVHEAFLRLTGSKEPFLIKDRSHFFTIAAKAMRRVLVDHARHHKAGRRIGVEAKVALDDAPELATSSHDDLLMVHHTLERLAEINPRQAKLVELRYFGGLTNQEAAEVLQVSLATVERDWQVARVWLHRRLTEG